VIGSVGRNYGLGYRLAELAEAISKITYPALGLSNLVVRQAGDSEADPIAPA
jgi:hypothetical protein